MADCSCWLVRMPKRARSEKKSKSSKRRKGDGGKGWYSKGTSSKKHTRGAPSTVKIPGVVGTPDKCFIKMRSVVSGGLTSTSGAFATTKIAKLNSLLDPTGDLLSIGTIGVDPWIKVDGTGVYLSYRVHAVRFKITFASAATNYYKFAIAPRFTSAAAPTSVDQCASSGRGRNGLVTNVTNGGTVVSGFYTIAELAGLSKEQLAVNDNFAAGYASDPNSLIYLDACVQALDGTSTAVAYMHVDLIQYVELFNKKTMSQ